MSEAETSSAWARAMAALGSAGDRLAADMRARDGSMKSDDIVKSMLGALMNLYLTQWASDANEPTFIPCTGYYQRLGSPNPDTIYRSAAVQPDGVYRLTGERGTARDVTIMPFTRAMRGGVPFNLSDVATGDDGAFDVIVSAERPEGHDGDWWRLDPETTSLWLREVSDRWGAEREARIAIVRLNPSARAEPSAEALDRRIAALATTVERILDYGIRHVDDLVNEGYVGRLKEVDYGATGAMPLQFYHEGLFDLADEDCLLIECRLAPGCDYISWSITDRMLITLDWMNAFTSLNSAQAMIDPDGVLRVIVAKTDPGTPNWMETLGYRQVVPQLRSIGAETPPVFDVRTIPLSAVFDHLPAGTRRVGGEERRAALRERQRAWQLRRIW